MNLLTVKTELNISETQRITLETASTILDSLYTEMDEYNFEYLGINGAYLHLDELTNAINALRGLDYLIKQQNQEGENICFLER